MANWLELKEMGEFVTSEIELRNFWNYSQFQATFHANVPTSFQSSQIRFKVQKFILKFTSKFVNN